jgi:hypothetical protein
MEATSMHPQPPSDTVCCSPISAQIPLLPDLRREKEQDSPYIEDIYWSNLLLQEGLSHDLPIGISKRQNEEQKLVVESIFYTIIVSVCNILKASSEDEQYF